jgi:hypothetical protein
MVIDLKPISVCEREDLLWVTGDHLRNVSFPEVHPDRPSSNHFYRIVIEEDLLQRARRERIERQDMQS